MAGKPGGRFPSSTPPHGGSSGGNNTPVHQRTPVSPGTAQPPVLQSHLQVSDDINVNLCVLKELCCTFLTFNSLFIELVRRPLLDILKSCWTCLACLAHFVFT